MDSAIHFQRVTKIYSFGFLGKKQSALTALTLNIPKGSIFGFLGANGAGKTTAIKILMGLQFATEGSIRIFNENALIPHNKAKVGFLPERPYFHETMNANEFLNFHRSLYGKHKKKNLRTNKELLKIVGLENLQEKNLNDFSKGMLQRIGIAQALVNDPDLIVLDEPMSGLDPVGRKEMRNLIANLNKDGKTIFFSTHILSDVESICHKFAFLEKGVLKIEGSVSELIHPKLSKIEILFKNAQPNQSPLLLQAQKTGDNYLILCGNDKQAEEVSKEIWKLNGQIVSLQKEHKSLEDILFGDLLK